MSCSDPNTPWYRREDSVGMLVTVSGRTGQILAAKGQVPSQGILLGTTVSLEPGSPERSQVERLIVLLGDKELHLLPWTVSPVGRPAEEEGQQSNRGQ